jgi:hypothetical protein
MEKGILILKVDLCGVDIALTAVQAVVKDIPSSLAKWASRMVGVGAENHSSNHGTCQVLLASQLKGI